MTTKTIMILNSLIEKKVKLMIPSKIVKLSNQKMKPWRWSRPHLDKKKAQKQKRLCASVCEDQLSEVSLTLQVMQEMMIKKGLFNEFEEKLARDREHGALPKRKASGGNEEFNLDNSSSDMTIYKEAVGKQSTVESVVDPEITFKLNEDGRWGSSSSEEQDGIDTSDELMDVDNFIADCQAAASVGKHNSPAIERQSIYRRDETIRKAKAGKARAVATPGNKSNNFVLSNNLPFECQAMTFERQQANVVDEHYTMIGNIDETVRL